MHFLAEYNFLFKALLASIMAGISGGIIGTYIISKRMTFISGGISHIAFGGVGIAYYLGFNPFYGALLFSVLSSISIGAIIDKVKIHEDSIIGIFWAIGMAVGILFISMTPGYTPNLMTYLFGNILTVKWTDIYLMAFLNLTIITVFIFYHHQILAITFQEEYARSQRLPVNLIKYLMLIMTAITIVMFIRIIGIILIIAILTIPQAAAFLLHRNYFKIVFTSIIISIVSSFCGIIVSFYIDISSGSVIVLIAAFIYFSIFLIKKLINKKIIKKNLA